MELEDQQANGSTPAEGAPPPAAEGTGESTEQAAGQQQAQEQAAQQEQERFSRMAVVQARTEKEMRQLREDMRAKDEQLAHLQESANRLEALRASVQKGDYSGVEKELGGSYQKWTDAELDKPSPEQQKMIELHERIERMEKQSTEYREREKAQQVAAQEAEKASAINAKREYVKTELLPKAEGEALGFVAALGAHDSVIAEYDSKRQETGVEPDEMAVATAVEERLQEELTASLTSLMGLQKFRDLVSKLQEQHQTQQADKGNESKGKSITNADISEAVNDGEKVVLDDKEAWARAEAAMDRAIAKMA